MNTPITDAAWQDWVDNGNAGITLASPMKCLELGRAELMKALEEIRAHNHGNRYDYKEISQLCDDALAAARANFP